MFAAPACYYLCNTNLGNLGIKLGPENIYPTGESRMNNGRSEEVEYSYADEMHELCHCLLQQKKWAARRCLLLWGIVLLGSIKEKNSYRTIDVFSLWDTRHPLGLRRNKWETDDYPSSVAEGHSECRAGFYYSYCACHLPAAQHWSKAGSHPVQAEENTTVQDLLNSCCRERPSESLQPPVKDPKS